MPPGKGKGKGPGPGKGKGMGPSPSHCCSVYNQIREFYVQAAAANFTQISFDVNIPFSGPVPLTYFVDSIDWFDDNNCIIITNFQSNTKGVSDSVFSCQTLSLYFAGNLQRIV